jgi:hypothetical protein
MDDFEQLAASLPILAAVIIASGTIVGTSKYFLGFENENKSEEGRHGACPNSSAGTNAQQASA